MIKIIAIMGEPATGKTTLTLELMNLLGEGVAQSWKAVKYVTCPSARCIVLGVFDGSTFQGTDRLSMSVQPGALAFVQRLHSSDKFDGYTVIFEGDRLSNQKFFDAVGESGIPLNLFLLTASTVEKERRHKKRGDTQEASWLAGRGTKYANLAKGNPLTSLNNETAQERTVNVQLLMEAIQGVGRELLAPQP